MKLIVYTGVHGTGKTTRMLQDAAQYKIDNPTKNVGLVPELARMVPEPTYANREMLIKHEYDMFYKKIHSFDTVFSDRSSLDTFAYHSLKHPTRGINHYYEDIMQASIAMYLHLPESTEIEVRFFTLKNADLHYNVKEDSGRGGTEMHDSKRQREILESELMYVYQRLQHKWNSYGDKIKILEYNQEKPCDLYTNQLD